MTRSFLYNFILSKRIWAALAAIICVTVLSYAASPALTQEPPKEQKQGGQASPQGPKTSPQAAANLPAYSLEQIQAGQALFAGQCSF